MLPLQTVFELFISGGPLVMILITLLFIALFFAAWKAPAWVKEIGIAALVVGVFATVLGFFQAADAIHACEEGVPMYVVAGGFELCLISTLYGLIVYFVSLVLRVIQKPRI